MEQTDLKLCPFCGSSGEMKHTSTWDYYVKCTNPVCGARTRNHHDNEVGAAISWNKRVEPDAPTLSDLYGIWREN